MPDVIHELFCNPPLAVARLGGSTTPLAAYRWVQPANPRTDGETVIAPDWSLNILPDGSADPFRPQSIRFKDGDLIRPVCPFIEVWARVGPPGSLPTAWHDAPLTPALLAAQGLDVGDLTFTVTAFNRKAARRMNNPGLAFGTFQPVVVRGDVNTPVALAGRSPPGAAPAMIPSTRTIPLGSVQVLRSRPQPSAGAAPWAGSVNVEVVRLRFTPARGAFYGPPASATATASDAAPAVLQANAFLAAGAGWFNVPGQGDFVTPPDTFDERAPGSGVSLGVVDDTCDARVEASLATGGGTVLRAHANVFVAPPDFAPDRRPFVSAADELNDRAGNAQARNAALQGEALERWVEDLFERIYEHVSLTNVDLWRKDRGRSLSNAELAAPIPGDNLAPDNLAMGSRDPLRNREATVGPFTADNPLPLADRAREQHRALADVGSLRAFVRQNPQRLRQLVRSPFEVRAGESPGLSDMRMPPFMRQSNALPLTLAAWQYDLLMRWVDGVVAAPAAGELAAVAPGPQPLSDEAAAARTAVLARVALEAGP